MVACRYNGNAALVLEENELETVDVDVTKPDGSVVKESVTRPSGRPRLLVWDRDGGAVVHRYADPARVSAEAPPAAPAPSVPVVVG